MRQATGTITVKPVRPGLIAITDLIRPWFRTQGLTTGLLTMFCQHTSASLLIQENASPAVRDDLEAYFERIAPEAVNVYTHADEGPDDMPAHLKTALTQVNLSIPLIDGDLALGTWQGIYLFEHRRHPPRRIIALHLIGE